MPENQQEPLRVFLASSGENREVMEALESLLEAVPRPRLQPVPWSAGAFRLSQSYIESLEKAVERADYAVFVVTPDDFVTTVRGEERALPRDNVVFEAGLFMGVLGRERCFLVHRKIDQQEGNLPSDLGGVSTAPYPREEANLERALAHARDKIVQAIQGHQAELARTFGARAAGSWWQLISTEHGFEASYFEIVCDGPGDPPRIIGGQHFNAEGEKIGTFKSTVSRVLEDQNILLYGWRGRHSMNHVKKSGGGLQPVVEGYGDIEFQQSDAQFESATGGFVDLAPNRSDLTQMKTVDIKRAKNPEWVETMQRGTRAQKRERMAEMADPDRW